MPWMRYFVPWRRCRAAGKGCRGPLRARWKSTPPKRSRCVVTQGGASRGHAGQRLDAHLRSFAGPFAFERGEVRLAEADGLRGDLDEFVVGDEREAALEAWWLWRREFARDVGGRPPDVGELFRFANVHDEVVFAGVQTHDLAFVDLGARFDEEDAALLCVSDAVGEGRAGLG